MPFIFSPSSKGGLEYTDENPLCLVLSGPSTLVAMAKVCNSKGYGFKITILRSNATFLTLKNSQKMMTSHLVSVSTGQPNQVYNLSLLGTWVPPLWGHTKNVGLCFQKPKGSRCAFLHDGHRFYGFLFSYKMPLLRYGLSSVHTPCCPETSLPVNLPYWEPISCTHPLQKLLHAEAFPSPFPLPAPHQPQRNLSFSSVWPTLSLLLKAPPSIPSRGQCRIMSPTLKVYLLVPKTCEYLILHNKRVFADVIH